MSTDSITDEEGVLRIVQGPLWSAIWVLTWPIMINMCAFSVGTFADTWVAGRLSADAQAAMGIGWQICYFMMMLTMALEVGATAIVQTLNIMTTVLIPKLLAEKWTFMCP